MEVVEFGSGLVLDDVTDDHGTTGLTDRLEVEITVDQDGTMPFVRSYHRYGIRLEEVPQDVGIHARIESVRRLVRTVPAHVFDAGCVGPIHPFRIDGVITGTANVDQNGLAVTISIEEIAPV